jgi:hypothetical protein
MARTPKTTCCQSTPRCARCPVRLALEARARERRSAMERLFHEIYHGAPPPAVPEPVAEALAAIAAARPSRRRPAQALV